MSQENLTQKLQQEIQDLARLPEMNPGPVIRVNPKGEVLLANSSANEIFGIPVLQGKSWLELCPDLTEKVWQDIQDSPEPYGHEADVNERCYLFIHVNSDISDNTFVYGSDVTQIKLIERELEAQKEVLSEMARFPDMNPGPALRMEDTGSILLSNVAAKEVFGEVVGKNWRKEILSLNDDQWDAILRSYDQPESVELRVGERSFVFVHRRETESGNVFVFGTEITKQKLAERSLKQSEKMATLGTLAAGVAHELNNPAAATTRASENLKEQLAQL